MLTCDFVRCREGRRGINVGAKLYALRTVGGVKGTIMGGDVGVYDPSRRGSTRLSVTRVSTTRGHPLNRARPTRGSLSRTRLIGHQRAPGEPNAMDAHHADAYAR